MKKLTKDAFGSFLLQLLPRQKETKCPWLQIRCSRICSFVRVNMCMCMHLFMYASVCVFSYNENFNPIALRKATIAYNLGLSECNRVNILLYFKVSRSNCSGRWKMTMGEKWL